ncbi:MAG TPA: cysteine dioxygenase [Mycobacteriales bacterium]|nr:cysteine dioxygenase [Mycobacteriales bacterium]
MRAAAVDLLPYAHPSVAGARGLAGVLAPRPRWSERDLARLTRLFATRAADELHQAARFDPVEPWQLLLAATEQVEVWLQTWTPWQGTGPHGHGQSAGAYTILLGELTGTWRSDRGRTRQAVRAAGASASFGAGSVHALQNRGAIEAITVHAYSPPLGGM